jgi:hypothetical protein
MAREGMAALIKQNANGKVTNRETGQSSLANRQMIAGLKNRGGGPGSRHMKLLFLRDFLVLSRC